MVSLVNQKLQGKESTTVSINKPEEETVLLNESQLVQSSSGSRQSRPSRWTAAVIIVIGFLVGFMTLLASVRSAGNGRYENTRIDDASVEDWFLKASCNDTIAEYLQELTRTPHVAGTRSDMETAQYVLQHFQAFGLPAHFRDYAALLSYPSNISLSLQLLPSTHSSLLTHSSSIDPENVIPPFHAYSPSGSVTAEVVYVNYGREQDFKTLLRMRVNVTGCIAVARYGETFRGDVVRRAAKYGAVAVLIYSDPKQFAASGSDGFFPYSKWLPPDGAQRGTVMDGMGDPSTVGFASTLNSERISPANNSRFPPIPSLPISAENAQHILQSLAGPVAPADWQGSLHLNSSYRLGKGPGVVKFSYTENQTIVTIRNVFAVITGSEEPDRYVILGNHRDAWAYGAVDPNSGTAALLQIARNLGLLLQKGWRPRRSILLCSWDAEEYGMIGSTEWVEENVAILGAKAVAYLNVDCAVQGSGFFASSSPQLDDLLVQVTKQVADPDAVYGTVHDSWAALSNAAENVQIGRLGGGGSDFAAFLQHAGVPSLDLFYGKDFAVYHTRYDTFQWMAKFGDPLFHRHVAVASVWGLVALRLADDKVLPFEYVTYAHELQEYAETVRHKTEALENVIMDPILSAIKDFLQAATAAKHEAEELRNADFQASAKTELRKRALNDRLMQTERAFLDFQGLQGRPWLRHLIYGPSRADEYRISAFPGVVDAIRTAKDGEFNQLQTQRLQHEIWRVARKISQASATLTGNLT